MDLKNNQLDRKEEKQEIKRNSFIRNICLIGLFSALMCVLSPISIPVGVIPITLATLVLYLISAIFDFRISVSIVLVYLFLGSIGLPVFSSFQGGFQVILGPTGGYLIGYLPCAFLESLWISRCQNKKFVYPLAMLLGTVILYTIGTIWFMVYSQVGLVKALMGCVVPFLAGDALKIVIASTLAIHLRPLFKKRYENN